jgi:hypothetical protein
MNYVRLTLSIFYYKDITLVAWLMSLSVARQQLGSGFDIITCPAELTLSKRRGPVVSIYASYIGTQFECRPTDRGIPWYYSFPPGICQGRTLNYFTSAHFQFIIIFLCAVSQAQNSFWGKCRPSPRASSGHTDCSRQWLHLTLTLCRRRLIQTGNF